MNRLNNYKHNLTLHPIHNESSTEAKQVKMLLRLPSINHLLQNQEVAVKASTSDLSNMRVCRIKNCPIGGAGARFNKREALVNHYLEFHKITGAIKKDPSLGFVKFNGKEWEPVSATRKSSLEEILALIDNSSVAYSSTKASKANPKRIKPNFKEYVPTKPLLNPTLTQNENP